MILALAAAAGVAALAAGLPKQTFFVGDSGVKWIATRNAIARPRSPLSIPLPRIGDQFVAYLDPFFTVHGDHAHAVTSELFPLATAPLAASLGTPGLYVLPAIGFLLTIASCVWLATSLDRRRNPIAVLATSVLMTPVLFYGLEFWEHAPAVGLSGAGTVLLLRGEKVRSAFAAGLCLGCSALLRPEAIWFVAALLAAHCVSPMGLPRRRLVVALSGVACTVLFPAAFWMYHSSSPFSPHISSNAFQTSAWLDLRLVLVTRWFFDANPIGLASVAVAIIGAALCRRRREGVTQAVAVGACIVSVALAMSRGFGAQTVWAATPAVLVALLPSPARNGRPFLAVLASVFVALVVLTAPNDGGGQWGPRYLLLAWIPLSILTADSIEHFARRGGFWLVVVAVVVLGSAWIQRSGYRELRTTKRIYGRVLDFVRQEVPPGGLVVSDLWWLDQVAAFATDDRQILFAPSRVEARQILELAQRAQIPNLNVIISRGEGTDVHSWVAGTCYVSTGTSSIPERELVSTRFKRFC